MHVYVHVYACTSYSWTWSNRYDKLSHAMNMEYNCSWCRYSLVYNVLRNYFSLMNTLCIKQLVGCVNIWCAPPQYRMHCYHNLIPLPSKVSLSLSYSLSLPLHASPSLPPSLPPSHYLSSLDLSLFLSLSLFPHPGSLSVPPFLSNSLSAICVEHPTPMIRILNLNIYIVIASAGY